jgi:DNA-binding NarL/FixJ family response regulator
MSITIGLADDHDIVRQGLRLLLEGQPDFRVIGEAAGGIETVSLVKTLQPHVLVVDLMMSDLNGLEVTRQVQRSAPATHVVIRCRRGPSMPTSPRRMRPAPIPMKVSRRASGKYCS